MDDEIDQQFDNNGCSAMKFGKIPLNNIIIIISKAAFHIPFFYQLI